MTDNTQLNTGSGGDLVRTLDRTGTGAPKTEIVQIDLGGATPNAEKLIKAGPQLAADSIPVVISNNGPPVKVETNTPLDDNGIPYMNTNHPDSDVATETLQSAQLTKLASIAASNPPFTLGAATYGSINTATTVIGPLTLNGATAVTFWVSGTYSGVTVNYEVSSDGINYLSQIAPRNTAFIDQGSQALGVNSTTCNIVPTSGYAYFRIRASAYTSGSAQVILTPMYGSNTALTSAVVTGGNGAAGAAFVGRAVGVAGIDGSSNLQIIKTDTTGVVNCANTQWGSTALGTPTNFGTTPGAVVAGSVNSSTFIGTTVATAASAGIQKVGIVGNAGTAAIFDSATGATVPANALLHGARAQNANPTAVTNGQMVAVAADLAGRLIVTPLNYRTLHGSTATTISATGATTIAAAAGASVFRDVVAICISTAGLAAQTITISDGTTSWILDYPNAALAPGSPFKIVFGDTPWRATTSNTAWTANQSVATACHYLVTFVDRLA